MKRDFLHITDFTTEEIWETLELSKWIKKKFRDGEKYEPFNKYIKTPPGGTVAYIISINGINKISMAFFDMDLGSPTLIGLEFIKNSLNVGSIIAFDEYYAYKGSLKGEYYAFEKFRENNKQLEFRKFKNWGINGMSFIVTKI